jgi:poly(3-hydroxybutyrate) depolymerase
MLYDTYQVHSDVLAPIRLMAEFFRGVLTQPWPLIENAPLVRSAAAAMELLSNAGMSHDRPEFGIRKVTVDGEGSASPKRSSPRIRSASSCIFARK